MDRRVTGFHQDEDGDWVAELSCGHAQHVRHRPPFQVREWVLSPEGRASRLGCLLRCPVCERAEPPEGLVLVRCSAEWTEHTLPKGLLRAHRLAEGTWGRLIVRSGRLGVHAATTPPIDLELEAGMMLMIPPEVEHEVRLLGPVACVIEFLVPGEAREEGLREGS